MRTVRTYRINPSGRVPYLIRDDGVGLEESAVICAYLDHLDGKPAFDLPAGDQAWEARRLESLARSMVDGLAVWSREIARPQDERSPTVLQHEAHRSERMADLWEAEIDHPLMRGALNLAQITLACGLGLEARNPDFRWRPGHPKLCDWFDQHRRTPVVRSDSTTERTSDGWRAALTRGCRGRLEAVLPRAPEPADWAARTSLERCGPVE